VNSQMEYVGQTHTRQTNPYGMSWNQRSSRSMLLGVPEKEETVRVSFRSGRRTRGKPLAVVVIITKVAMERKHLHVAANH